MSEINKAVVEKKLSQVADKAMGTSQPRVSGLIRGKVDKFNILYRTTITMLAFGHSAPLVFIS